MRVRRRHDCRIAGRTIHTYHTEGAGGGRADILRIAGFANVLPSSTNPTRPYTRNTLEEHLDMLMVCHHLNLRAGRRRLCRLPDPGADDDGGHPARSRRVVDRRPIRRRWVASARLSCTWQTADKMKQQRGLLSGDTARHDNGRIKRYVAKYTINPAIARLAEHVGSIDPGSSPTSWSGTRVLRGEAGSVLKGGLIAWAAMGDPNASPPAGALPTDVRRLHPDADERDVRFAGGARRRCSARLGLRKRPSRCATRTIGKESMVHNEALLDIQVDPETCEVRADGELLECEAASLPLARRYFLF